MDHARQTMPIHAMSTSCECDQGPRKAAAASGITCKRTSQVCGSNCAGEATAPLLRRCHQRPRSRFNAAVLCTPTNGRRCDGHGHHGRLLHVARAWRALYGGGVQRRRDDALQAPRPALVRAAIGQQVDKGGGALAAARLERQQEVCVWHQAWCELGSVASVMQWPSTNSEAPDI